MRNLFWLFVLFICFWTTSAMGVVDPEPNKIGVYFDSEGNIPFSTGTIGDSFVAYVIVTNLTESDGIGGFAFGYDIEAIEGSLSSVVRTASILPPNSLAVPEFDHSSPFHGDYLVGLGAPLSGAAAVVVVSWEFMVLSFDFVLGFDLRGAESEGGESYDQPIVVADSILISLGVSEYLFASHFFYYGYHSAVLAPSGPVPTTSHSWGKVKSLYR